MQAMHVPRHRHSPRVRRLAREAGIDPDAVAGTGPNGRVRPADVAVAIAAVVDASSMPATYVAELDLSGIPNAMEDRLAVVASIAYALLRAVRRHLPITDIEVLSGDDRRLISSAHDLTRAAIAHRLDAPSTGHGHASSAAALTVIDSSKAGDVLRVTPPRADCLLNAVIGPTVIRPTTCPGPAGLPTIEFHPAALLAVSTNSAQLALLEVVNELINRSG